MRRRVLIVTPFYDSNVGFNLVEVVERQIRTLHQHGYDPAVVVQKNFQGQGYWNPHKVDLRAVLPKVGSYSSADERIEDDVDAIADALREVVREFDVVLTHDLFHHAYFLRHNLACRRVAGELPQLLWLNWIHSPPQEQPGETDPRVRDGIHSAPPGYLVHPHRTGVDQVCRMYRTDETRVRVVHPAVDPCDVIGAGDLTRSLYAACEFSRCDLCIVHPARPHQREQVDKVVRLAAEFERAGVATGLLLIDWFSAEEPYRRTLEELKQLAASLDFEQGFFVASEIDERCRGSTDEQTVLQLINLADVFVLPSQAEAYSRRAHEALLSGSLVILNGDLPHLTELFNGFTRYLPFGSATIDRQYWRVGDGGGRESDEQAFWHERALEILAEIRGNRSLHAKSAARTQWSSDAVFLREVEPLFHLEPAP